MIRRVWWGVLCALLLLALDLRDQESLAQVGEALYFPETGHWVTGNFLNTYTNVSDPYRVFGAPITDAFLSPNTNEVVQYFEKARFVSNPQNPPGLRVQLTPLGKLLYTPGIAPSYSPKSPSCRYFPETGFKVCYAFLDFFKAYGGEALFGYPISNFEIHNGRTVQFFQRARFEWHPELPHQQHVLLGDLGIEYFKAAAEDSRFLLPNINDNIPRSILTLKIRTSVAQAVMPRSGQQTLYVIVQDQNLRPVSNAEVTYTLLLPTEEQFTSDVPFYTDESGLVIAKFEIVSRVIGIAQVIVNVAFESFHEQTITSFRIWW